jgi:hypothetical protein
MMSLSLGTLVLTAILSAAAPPLDTNTCPAIDSAQPPAESQLVPPTLDAVEMDDYDPAACLAQSCPWINCSSAAGCWNAYLHDVCYCPLEPDRESRRQCRVDAERALTDCTKSSGH